MKIKITALVLALLLFIGVRTPSMTADAATVYYSSQAYAGTYVVANMSEYSCGVSVRSTASYAYSSIATINTNTAYKLIAETTDSYGRPWYKINYNGSKYGWVCGLYTHKVTVRQNNYIITSSSRVNMRKGPSTSYSCMGQAFANNYYSLIGCAGEGFSLGGTKWYQVMDNKMNVFWIKGTLVSQVKISSNITCDVNTGTYFSRTYKFKAASYARTGPSTSNSKVRSSAFGTSCVIDISSVVLNTSNQLWYGVEIRYSGKTYNGYVLSSLLK